MMQVTDQILEDLFVLLKEEGVALPQGKEDSLRVQMSGMMRIFYSIQKKNCAVRVVIPGKFLQIGCKLRSRCSRTRPTLGASSHTFLNP